MKVLKKTFNIFLIAVLLFISFITPVYRVKAKTLGELKQELKATEEYYANLREEKELSQIERENIMNEIHENEGVLLRLKQDTEELDAEIAELNKTIESKYNEIKRIINYQQVSSGESSYLEYIFGARTFTDFIYRASVSEQLSKYNKVLIDGYEEDIKKAQAKQKEIEEKRSQISELQITLASQYAQLGQKISNLNDDMLTAEEEAKLLRANILDLQNTYRCDDDDEIEVCKQKAINSTYIPPSSGDFIRPLNNAEVTANYGYYDPYYNGNVTWHAAMDLAGGWREPIYPAADGKVVATYHQSCGNYIIYIVHNINGNRYTTGYWHLSDIYVEVGQYVTAYTQIGIQGGEPWEDECSTGQHLDFLITTGAYKMDYFENPRSVSVNPRNYIYFPPLIEYATGVGSSMTWYER